MKSDDLRRELMALVDDDWRTREELAAEGSLFKGYHPRMEAVHRRNAARLREIIEAHGWPGRSLVGEDGEDAAWLIVQHAIAEPDFQRRGLVLVREAAGRGEAPLWQPAMLEDRIRMFEGRPQVYGTQIVAGPGGEPQPWEIEDPGGVDERRRSVGLDPLHERLARAERVPLPEDPERFDREYEAWLRRVGWRE